MAILQRDLEVARGQHLDHAALEFYVFLSPHFSGQKLLASLTSGQIAPSAGLGGVLASRAPR
jgi:hypothetical protein